MRENKYVYSPVTNKCSSKLSDIVALRMADVEMDARIEERPACFDSFAVCKLSWRVESLRKNKMDSQLGDVKELGNPVA